MTEHPIYAYVVERLYEEFETSSASVPTNRFCLFPEYAEAARERLRRMPKEERRGALASILRLSFQIRACGYSQSADAVRSIADEYPSLTREVAASILQAQSESRIRQTRTFLGLS